MNREEFLKSEKDKYGKIYVDLTYAIDNIGPFIEKDKLDQRKYVNKLPVLKKYIDLLEAAERETSKKGGLLGLFKDDNTVDLLNSYKKDNIETFNQLEHCKNCVYINCAHNHDKFDGCLGCRPNSRIAYCDHDKINVTLHDNWNLRLNNDNTGEVDNFKVLATLHDVERDQKYIILHNRRTDEKFVLYYVPGISEDSYGEISDPEEFDFVVSTYQNVAE